MTRFADFADLVLENAPQVGLVLGSGMGQIAQQLAEPTSLPFTEIPNLGTGTSVAGHKGCLTVGTWLGRRVLLFEGRLHYYEGYPWRLVTEPIRIASFLGVKTLLVTNAAGGIHPSLQPGSLMALSDHCQWNKPYCWREPGPGAVGPERPSPYDPQLLARLLRCAEQLNIPLLAGKYACLTGPCYETPAEIRALQVWGADAVGMSTAREIELAHELGIACVGISCITNRAAGLSSDTLDHREVLVNAQLAVRNLAQLITEFLRTS